MTFPGFRPAAFAFLDELAANNARPWFLANKARYEEHVRAPLALLVEEIDVRLAELAPELTGSPKKSIFRIYRDVRFSKNKAPYKTNAACWWGHRDAAGRDDKAHPGAGLYFQLGAEENFAAGGTWMPPRPTLNTIRLAIAKDLPAFAATMQGAGFARSWKRLDEEGMLTRLPRGYAPGHPAEAWLRYTSFTATAPLTRRQVTSRTLPDLLMAKFETLLPLMRWLNEAQGLKRASRR